MKRSASRTIAIIFAAALAFGGLTAIAALARVDSPTRQTVVVMPRVEVTARPEERPSALATAAAALGERL